MKTVIAVITVMLLCIQTTAFSNTFEFPEVDRTQAINKQFDKFNIPDNLLKTMSTEELIDVCLKWPSVFTATYAFNTDKYAVDFLYKNFNGFRELFLRKDSSTALLDVYASIDLNDIKDQMGVYGNGLRVQHKQAIIELLLLDNVIYSKLRTDEIERLRSITLKKFEFEKNNLKSIGYAPMEHTAKILLNFVKNESPPETLDLRKSDNADWLLYNAKR